MNTHPLVSIVIPVYNGGNYLRASIDSALEQTYDNIEILVVNDGSKDNGETERIALSYGDKIRYFRKDNGGVSSALNYAIAEMRGEWFSWLSHDDLYYPDKIKQQIDYLNAACTGIEKCVLLCGSELMDCDGNTVYKFRHKKHPMIMSSKEVMLNNLKHNRLGGCTFLVPRSAFDEVGGFSIDNRTMSDFDMWYRLLLNGYTFCDVNEDLVRTRVHKKQVTYTMAERGAVEIATFYTWVIEEIAKQPNLRDKETFYKLAQYSLERGLVDSATVAFDYAKTYEDAELLFKFKKNIIGVRACVYKMAKSIARRIFAAIAVR